MKYKTQLISLEEDDKDIIVSFVIKDEEIGIKSLILHRTFFFEEMLDAKERGVKVSFEGDYFEQENFNILRSIKISNEEITIKSAFREYELDISSITKSEIEEMIVLLNKQNADNKFTMCIA